MKALFVFCNWLMAFAFVVGAIVLQPASGSESARALGFVARDFDSASRRPTVDLDHVHHRIIRTDPTGRTPGVLAIIASRNGSLSELESNISQLISGEQEAQSSQDLALSLKPASGTVVVGTLLPAYDGNLETVDLNGLVAAKRAKIDDLESELTSAKSTAMEAQVAFEAETSFLVADLERKNQQLITNLESESTRYRILRLAEAEALASRLVARGERKISAAQALRIRLAAEALSRPGGEFVGPLEAAKRFRLGAIHLDPRNSEFFGDFGSLPSWRAFFAPRQ